MDVNVELMRCGIKKPQALSHPPDVCVFSRKPFLETKTAFLTAKEVD